MLKRDSDLKYVINPRRACAARVTVLAQSVFLSVSVYSRTTGYQAAYEQYQRLHRNIGSKNNVADFAETSNKFVSEKLALSWCVCLYVVYARQPVASYPGRFRFFSTTNDLGKASQPAHPRAALAWHASELCSIASKPGLLRACSVSYNYAWEYYRRQILSRDACR